MVRGVARLVEAAAVVLLAVSGLVAGAARAQPAGGDGDGQFGAEVRRVVGPLVQGGIVPSMVVGVRRGDVVEFHALGTLTPGGVAAPTPDTVFEIGSISKVFTAILLSDAVRRGEVSFDDPIGSLLPEGVAPPAFEGRVPTLRELATHRSGLPRMPANISPADVENPFADYGRDDLHAFIGGLALPRAPGAAYEYSNLGAGLLGDALAQRLGVPYEAALRERVLGPLGLTDTTITLSESQRARFAPPHQAGGVPTKAWDFDALAGAGAVRSTARDLMRLAEAVLSPQGREIDEAISATLARQADAQGSFSIATGWHIAGDGHTRWHNGQTGGSSSALFVSGELRQAVVVLCNGADPAVTIAAERVFQAAAGMQAAPVQVPKIVPVEGALLESLVGEYENERLDVKFIVTRDGERLMAQIPGQPALRVWPQGGTVFAYREVDARLAFDGPEEGGKSAAVTLFQNGMEIRCERVE